MEYGNLNRIYTAARKAFIYSKDRKCQGSENHSSYTVKEKVYDRRSFCHLRSPNT